MEREFAKYAGSGRLMKIAFNLKFMSIVFQWMYLEICLVHIANLFFISLLLNGWSFNSNCKIMAHDLIFDNFILHDFIK